MLDERKSLADEESAARTEPSWQSVDALPAEPLPCAVAPCSTFRCLASPMFLLVWGLVGLTYFPYVLWTVHVTLTSRACVVVFHVLLLLLLASYLMCVFTDPGTVPPEWHRAVSSDPQLAAQHRVCPRTGLYRPLRSHYCSVTRRVVLNMDHFCPWVVNTVGFYNRKFFLLFLSYTTLTCLFVVATSVPLIRGMQRAGGPPRELLVAPWSPTKHMVTMMALMLDTALGVMLICFCGFHVRMAMLNETTIEGHSPAFDVSSRRNWEQVMGTNPYLWALPLYGAGPAGDGVHWPSMCASEAADETSGSDDTALLTRDRYSPYRGGSGGSDSSVDDQQRQHELTDFR